MRVYLKQNYHEVVAGDPNKIFKVLLDNVNPALPRYFIEATEKERLVLEQLEMLEIEPPEKPKAGDLVNDEAPAPPITSEKKDEYMCVKHKRNHKKGTSLYIACYELNFGAPLEKKE
jgi:hypothetical protein